MQKGKNMENFNSVNDEQGAVVGTTNTADDVSVAAEGVTEGQSGTSAEEVATPHQNAETNAAFAQMRRSMEQAQRERDEVSRRMADLERGLAGAGYKGTAENIIEQLEAENLGLTVEQLRTKKQGQSEAVKASPEYKRLEEEVKNFRQKEAQALFEKDLAAIKALNPNENAADISELGEKYFKLRAAGIDNLTAYKAIADSRPTSAPADIGKVSSSGNEKSNYYTNEELDNLTPSQLDNPSVLKKALRSMKHLK